MPAFSAANLWRGRGVLCEAVAVLVVVVVLVVKVGAHTLQTP